MIRQAQNAREAGDGDLELRRLRQFLAANPQSPDARVLLARHYESRGLPDLALEHYRLAAAQFPESGLIAISLAKTLRAMGEPAEAVRGLHAFSTRAAGPNADALSLEGILEDELGHRAAAETALRAAVAAAPNESAIHNNLGYHLLAAGKGDAVAEFRRAIELDPKSEIAHNNLAAALARSTNPDAAREAVAEWSRSAGRAEAHNNLAAVWIEQGRYAEARTELTAALAIEPNLSAALANLRLVSERDGKPAMLPAGSSNIKPSNAHRSLWARLFSRRSESKPDISTNSAPATWVDGEPVKK
jgi:Flp pilus assembly protein TadD